MGSCSALQIPCRELFLLSPWADSCSFYSFCKMEAINSGELSRKFHFQFPMRTVLRCLQRNCVLDLFFSLTALVLALDVEHVVLFRVVEFCHSVMTWYHHLKVWSCLFSVFKQPSHFLNDVFVWHRVWSILRSNCYWIILNSFFGSYRVLVSFHVADFRRFP